MHESNTPISHTNKQRGWADNAAAKIANVLAWILVVSFFLTILLVIAVQMPGVQKFAKNKVQTYLRHKLNTKVEIGHMYISFPNSVSLDNVLIEDQTKDTLIAGGHLKLHLDMFALLKNEVQIRSIALEDITAKIKRVGSDTVFNYQFVIDAFMGDQKKSANSSDTTAMKMNVDKITLTNTRIVYKDIITGDDMDLVFGHLDMPIKTFDPYHLYYDIPSITLSGLRGYYYQNSPLKPKIDSAIAVAVTSPQKYLRLKTSVINLKDINVAYRSEPTNITTSLKIDYLDAHPDSIDLKSGIFAFKDISLGNSDIAVITSNRKAPARTPTQLVAKDFTPVFTLVSKQIKVNNSHLKVDNTDMPVLKTGMDYYHLDMHDINLTADNFYYNGDTTSGNVKSLSVNEKSGFLLTEANGDLLLTSKGIALNNLYLKTPRSELRRTIAVTFPTINNPVVLDMDLQNSKLAVSDLVTAVPMLKSNPAFRNTNEIWSVDGRVHGPMNDLALNNVRFSGLRSTSFYVSGRLKGLPDVNRFQADLTIPYLNTTKSDLLAVLPKNTIPSNITLPDRISLKGRIKGNTENLYTNVNISSNLGSVAINGNIGNITNPKTIKYNVAIATNNLNLGVILQDKKTYGLVSANFSIAGQGTDFTTANIKLNGASMSFTYNGYTYRNVRLSGTIANKKFDITANVHDPNADFTAHASGIYNGINTSLKLSANIDSIKTQPLHFSTDVAIYRGKIEGDFTNINPDKLDGTVAITKATIINKGQRFQLDSTSLFAQNNGTNQLIRIQSQFMYAEIKGQYKLTQLPDIIQQSIDPYYNLSAKKNTAKIDAHDFTINGKIYDNPALRAFAPSIKRLDSISIAMAFSTANGVNGSIDAPMLIYDTYEIAGLKVNADTKNNQINFTTSFDKFRSGKQIAVYATTINGTIANNTIDFSTTVKDKAGKNKYVLSGSFNQPANGNYVFHLKPGNILLNYDTWTVNTDNSIQVLNGDLVANNFILSKGSQQLTINSVGSGTNQPVSIDFKNFEVSTITGFIQSDSTLIGGSMTGNLLLKDYRRQPVFTANLTIDDFNMNKDTLGTVVAKVNNNVSNVYATDIRLTGRGNDVSILGNYYVKPDNNSEIDLNVDIKALQMKALEGPTMNAIKNASGTINGQIAVQGTLNDPVIDGRLNFNNAVFNVTALNSTFKVNNEQLRVHNGGVNFDNFIIKDSADNELALNGDLLTTNFTDYEFDLGVTADNFQVINSTKKQNKLFYGKMVLTTDLYVHGTSDKPIVDGTITVNDKTVFNVLLPQNDPAIEERKGVVRFVDVSATRLDSLFLQPYDSLNVSRFKGYDIAVNIQIDKNATFSLIVDESNGDFVNLKGEALITAGIDPSGKITLVGTYEINEGYYEITFKFLKRRFEIQKGSKITWNGEPTKADIDVSGVYVANASPIDLVETQISDASNIIKNTYRQKLPFEVWLTLKGEMMQPNINFDIKLPTEKNYNVSREIIDNVEYKLQELETEPSEMNKQVFALILLNRFVNENPFDNTYGTFDVQNYALSSVSKILTNQLNNLAKGLIDGVDVNFDLVTTADYTTGDKRNRTDFNVGLSKRLLNDRLTITVGSDFELQGPKPQNQNSTNTTADVAVDYKISRDGRYALRVYRKNDYQGIIEGYIIETGIGFRINVDYNHFSDIFKRSKARKNSKPAPVAADDKQKVALTKDSK